MAGGLTVIGILTVLVVLTIFMGVRIVPQGYKHVVQRLGKYHSTLNPGLNFVIPYLDAIAHKVITKDISLDIPTQEVITKDNAVIMTNALAFINIIEPQKAVYGNGIRRSNKGISTMIDIELGTLSPFKQNILAALTGLIKLY